MVILVDTSVWVDHLRFTDALLTRLISRNEILQHPFVTGEISVGNLRSRNKTVWALRALPPINMVDENDFHSFIETAQLAGSGLGFVDIHLLAAASLHGAARIWTRDRKMHEHAERLDLDYVPAP